jgi:capsular exopolysaccharide synthesis family protein
VEHIKSALKKAGVLDESLEAVEAIPNQGKAQLQEIAPKVAKPSAPTLREVYIDPQHLEKKRIVSQAMDDPNHIAFNMLRTRIRKTMADNKWKSLAITSPTAGCGKTMVTLNLAFSLARKPGLKTVAIDLDLKRPSIAPTLSIEPKASIAQFLLGTAKAEDCFVQVDQNLIFGLNSGHTPASSELLQASNMLNLLDFIHSSLSPDIVLFDLPPMRGSDDALAFVPRVDTSILVVASGTTTTAEVDECELQLNELDKLLGVVLNKCDSATSEEYYY